MTPFSGDTALSHSLEWECAFSFSRFSIQRSDLLGLRTNERTRQILIGISVVPHKFDRDFQLYHTNFDRDFQLYHTNFDRDFS